jgi:hypothetical protein
MYNACRCPGCLQILAAASHGVASLAADTQQESASRPEVQHVGHGIQEGGRALAKGMLRGGMGMLSKPMEGAKQSGLGGFLGGLGKVGLRVQGYYSMGGLRWLHTFCGLLVGVCFAWWHGAHATKACPELDFHRVRHDALNQERKVRVVSTS